MSKSLDALVEDIEFIGAEIRRLEETARSDIRGLHPHDVFSSIAHPSGGVRLIGRKADERITKMASNALSSTTYARRIHVSGVAKEFKTAVNGLLDRSEPVNGVHVQRALSAAIKRAAKDCHDRTHFFPAQLMKLDQPATFALGEVTFLPRAQFLEDSAEAVKAMVVASTAKGRRIESAQEMADEAIDYYQAFPWVIAVTIEGCDDIIARQRAAQTAAAAVDVVRLLGSDRNTRRMSIGGYRITDPRTAHLHTVDGNLTWTLRREGLQEVGMDGWTEWLERADNREVIAAAGRCLEVIRNPDMDWPMAARWIDAVSWFGQAVRDTSDAGRVIKFVTAIERMLMTGEKGDRVYATFCERAAALAFSPEDSFEDLREQAADIYDARSKLAHGSLSPFAPEVSAARFHASEFTRDLLLQAAAFISAFGHLEAKLSVKQIGAIWSTYAERIQKDGGAGLFQAS